METSSDSGDEYGCRHCDTVLKNPEDKLCYKCLDYTIKYWTCNRCGNCWSSEYSDERNYSDCCMDMMETEDINVDNIKYCDNTHITVYDNNKICYDCMKNKLPQCRKLLKAYTQDECKLKDFTCSL